MGILSIAQSQLNAAQDAIANEANNLANVGVHGFKKGRVVFTDTLYEKIKLAGAEGSDDNQSPTGIMLPTGVKVIATEKIFSQGALLRTNNPLDIAIQGSGFLQVLQPDGTIAYTRDGNLKQNASGDLVNASGLPIQPAINIPNDAQNIDIAANGEVSVQRAGVTGLTIVGRIELADFVNPKGLEPKGEGLYLETSASGVANVGDPNSGGFGSISQGFLEGSNVNSMESLVELMKKQKEFEIGTQILRKDGEMWKQTINSIG